MAVSFVATTKANGAGPNLTVNVPSGTTTNDIILALVGRNTTGADTITFNEAGWTTVDQPEAPNCGVHIAWRLATGSEPASYQINGPTTRGIAAIFCTYRGCHTTTPVSASAGTELTTGTNTSGPSVTIGANDSMWVVGAAVAADFGTVTPPTGHTVRNTELKPTSQIVGLFVGDEAVGTVDSPTGTEDYTHTSVGSREVFSIILQPSGSTDTPLTVDHAQAVFQGQTITMQVTLPIVNAQAAFQGQNINLIDSSPAILPIIAANATFEGQQIPFIYSATGLEAEAVFEGQDVPFSIRQIGQAAQAVFQGQEIGLVFVNNVTLPIVAAQAVFSPSAIDLLPTGVIDLNDMEQPVLQTMVQSISFPIIDTDR